MIEEHDCIVLTQDLPDEGLQTWREARERLGDTALCRRRHVKKVLCPRLPFLPPSRCGAWYES